MLEQPAAQQDKPPERLRCPPPPLRLGSPSNRLECNAQQASQQLGDVLAYCIGLGTTLVPEANLHQCRIVITGTAEPSKAVRIGSARGFDRTQAWLEAGLHSSQCCAEGLISLESAKRQLRAQRWG